MEITTTIQRVRYKSNTATYRKVAQTGCVQIYDGLKKMIH